MIDKTGHTCSSFALPRVLRVEPASSCNLACSHCPTGTIDMSRGIMSRAIFENVLRDVRGSEGAVRTVVLYHGGEPLLNPRFFEMVSDMRSTGPGLFIKTVSNGMAMNESNRQKLLDSGLDLIEFSLDGESAQENDRVRKKSNASRVIENILELIKQKKKYQLAKPNISISNTQFIRHESALEKRAVMVPKWLRDFFGDDVEYKTHYAVRWPHMSLTDNAGTLMYDILRDPNGIESNYCDHAFNTITVRANGDVVPCCYDLTSRLVMGNIQENTLSQIWKSDKYRLFRASFVRRNLVSICNNCAVVNPAEYLISKSV